MARPSLDNPALYFNRELSWLAFNRRVLQEAQDPRNPLLERLKFLAITANNLDEFVEIRVAGLLQQLEEQYAERGPDGLSPQEEKDRIAKELREFVADQYRCWNEQLLPEMFKEGIRIRSIADLDAASLQFVQEYCEREIDPLLTPVAVDPAHPFPRVINKALCLAFLLKRRRRSSTTFMGVVTVPRMLPRLVRLPSSNGHSDYIFLADLVAFHASSMYRGYDVVSAAAFRVTRNSNLYVEEEESLSLLDSVNTELHNRRKGDAVRLELEAGAAPEITDRLRDTFELEPWQVFQTDGPVNLSRLFTFYEQTNRPDLKFKPFVPRQLQLTGKAHDIFEELRNHDVLLHHPFDSYDSVVQFICAAAQDPRVKSIKQTLYRTSDDSPIVKALIEAAAKKEVTVVVELKARFDEASNIRWARSLEDAGVQVFHGLVRLKTHCKLSLLVRSDPDGVTRRYAHLGTGNYNQVTARVYTDLSLLTADPEMTTAVHWVFNFLTAYAERPSYEPLMVAPIDLAEKNLRLIEREAEHARYGRPARIIAKMNALLDKAIIQALYKASQAGVEIDLIVRGMCALRPGMRGVSENIRVRSIVGRFLEHSRIFYFANGGEEEVYVGSADWMPRNLYERVETMFPIRSAMLQQRLKHEVLDAYLADNVKARVLRSNGAYVRLQPAKRGKKGKVAEPEFNAQLKLANLMEEKPLQSAPPVRAISKSVI